MRPHLPSDRVRLKYCHAVGEMLADILKDPRFDTVFSFLMGVFLILLIRPVCKGESCFTHKAPPMKEIRDHAYKIGDTCYKFVPKDAKCPLSGVIEPFEWSASIK